MYGLQYKQAAGAQHPRLPRNEPGAFLNADFVWRAVKAASLAGARTLALLLLLFAGAGCIGAAPAPTTSVPDDGAKPSFAEGIHYAMPGAAGSRLVSLNDSSGAVITFAGVGFDLRPTVLVSIQDSSRMQLVAADGARETRLLQGVFHGARPSLSGDAKRVAFQALDHADFRGGAADDFNVYVADVETGATVRISNATVNDESPEWVPGKPWIVWSSFDPEAGIDAHVVDVDSKAEIVRIPDAGAIHLAVSRDGKRLLDPGRMRIYGLPGRALEADLKDEVLAGLAASGYAPDSRFPGQANRGTFPLDGSFSPDGSAIVFDGAVGKDGRYGVVLARIGTDGTGFTLLTGLLTVDPARANQHNFSLLNPVWL